MMTNGNDGNLIIGDDIDWTSIDCADESEIIGNEKYDIQELLGSIEFIDAICPELECREGSLTSWNDFLFVTSVGQPTCEKKDKAISESASTVTYSDSAANAVSMNVQRSTKSKNVSIGPSNRLSKKKIKGLPKRPLSAYNLFFQSERLKIFEEGVLNHERISFQGLAKLVGQRWQVLDDETRQELRRRSQEDITRYQNEMKEYRVKHCNDPMLNLCRKRSPPNSPKTSKSVMKLSSSPAQKRRLSEGSLGAPLESQNIEVGHVVNDAASTVVQTHTVGESSVRNKALGNIQFLNTEKSPLSSLSKMEKSDHGRDSSDLCRLVSISEPLVPAVPFPAPLPSLDHTSPIPSPSYGCQAMVAHPAAAAPFDCRTPSGACFVMHHQFRSPFFQNPGQVDHVLRTGQHPTNFAVSSMRSYVNTLPVGKEVKIYDPRTGIRRPYKIEYKCFAMTRSDANAYVTRYSYPGINGSYYVPLENILRAVPPPGVEVRIPANKSYE